MNSLITVMTLIVVLFLLLLVYGVSTLLIPFNISIVYLFLSGAVTLAGLASVRLLHGS